MPRKTPEQRLKELEDKKAAMEAQIAKTRAMVKKHDRARDTRRKIVAGAILLEHGDLNPAFGAEIDAILRKHVSRPQDRELFGFPPLDEVKTEPVAQSAEPQSTTLLDAARQTFMPRVG